MKIQDCFGGKAFTLESSSLRHHAGSHELSISIKQMIPKPGMLSMCMDRRVQCQGTASGWAAHAAVASIISALSTHTHTNQKGVQVLP